MIRPFLLCASLPTYVAIDLLDTWISTIGTLEKSLLDEKHSCLFFPTITQEYLKPGEGPIVLVLSPTRELAVQIKEECDKFGASSDIKNTVVYGGVPKSKQVNALRMGVEIVIATPGRLIDHLEQGNTNLRRVTYLGMYS